MFRPGLPSPVRCTPLWILRSLSFVICQCWTRHGLGYSQRSSINADLLRPKADRCMRIAEDLRSDNTSEVGIKRQLIDLASSRQQEWEEQNSRADLLEIYCLVGFGISVA